MPNYHFVADVAGEFIGYSMIPLFQRLASAVAICRLLHLDSQYVSTVATKKRRPETQKASVEPAKALA